ncbi:MAG: hypothetical protein GY847_22150 [Proteobacteria bacterium]|nr:hypothetical protein [Pseudomonadota bacterium]
MAISLFLLAACNGADDDQDQDQDDPFDSDDDPPSWPTVVDELPPCETDGGVFSEPDITPAHGLIRFDASALLQPVGFRERLRIKIYKTGSDSVDLAAKGPLQLDAGDAATVIEVTPIVDGEAEAVVRFEEPGVHVIEGSLPDLDGRTGTIEILAYNTQLPVWDMEINEQDLDVITSNPTERIKVRATLTIDNQTYATQVRIHGGSSREYRKKSFRFDLAKDVLLPDGSNHIILRAEWADKSMIRNYLALEVFRFGTWIPSPTTEFVHFRINSRYYGAMWHVERIDGDFLRSHGLNPEGSMYEADPLSEYWIPGGNLTPLQDLKHYEGVYAHQKGNAKYNDLIELIETTLQLSDKRFREVANQVINVNSVLAYMAAMAVIQNQDHIKKNFYIYRDPEIQDDRWVVFPWDLDLSLGHLWTEENDVLDETIFHRASLYAGERVPEHDFFNQLLSKLWSVPEFDDRFLEYVDHIVSNVFTPEFIGARINNVLCRAAPEIVSDHKKRAETDEYLERVDEIRAFVNDRREFIRRQLKLSE